MVKTKQDRQCTYNVTLRRVRATIVAVEDQYYIFWVRVCSLSYPACTEHEPYYIVTYGLFESIFPHYLINVTIFGGGGGRGGGGKFIEHKCAF